MTAKQKAIAAAYGEHWEKVKDLVDDNGWIRFVDMACYEIGLYVNDIEKKDDSIGFNDSWRPLSLKGIEHNNGWVRIESEADLPKTETKCLVIRKDSPTIIRKATFYIDPDSDADDHLKAEISGWLKVISHWQPLPTEIPLPIY